MDYLSINRETYNALASEYQSRRLRYADHQQEVLKPFIEEALRRSEHPRILEIGCGVGLDAEIMMRSGLHVEAVDFSEAMVTYARQNVPGLQVSIGDFLQMRFEKSFHGICMSAFLQLFPKDDAIRVLYKVHSLLFPKGIGFISMTRSTSSQEGLLEKAEYGSNLQRYRKQWTKEELAQVLECTGFHVISWFEDQDPVFHRQWMSVLVECF